MRTFQQFMQEGIFNWFSNDESFLDGFSDEAKRAYRVHYNSLTNTGVGRQEAHRLAFEEAQRTNKAYVDRMKELQASVGRKQEKDPQATHFGDLRTGNAPPTPPTTPTDSELDSRWRVMKSRQQKPYVSRLRPQREV